VPVFLTELNPSEPRAFALGQVEAIRWQSKDGTGVEGILVYPVGFEHRATLPRLSPASTAARREPLPSASRPTGAAFRSSTLPAAMPSSSPNFAGHQTMVRSLRSRTHGWPGGSMSKMC
jgi:hypothetical protein